MGVGSAVMDGDPTPTDGLIDDADIIIAWDDDDPADTLDVVILRDSVEDVVDQVVTTDPTE